MKLVAAKCPSCGADINIDKDSDSTRCEFCNSKILVDDAVSKYKVELSGKVKVSGIKDEDDKLDIIKKHFKVGNINQAYNLLQQLLNDNPFNIEALKLKINYILDQPNITILNCDECLKTLNIIKKIDEYNKYTKYVESTREKVLEIKKNKLSQNNYHNDNSKRNNLIIIFSIIGIIIIGILISLVVINKIEKSNYNSSKNDEKSISEKTIDGEKIVYKDNSNSYTKYVVILYASGTDYYTEDSHYWFDTSKEYENHFKELKDTIVKYDSNKYYFRTMSTVKEMNWNDKYKEINDNSSYMIIR